MPKPDEIKKIKACLKKKDEQIENLEKKINCLEEHDDDGIRWFNVSTYVIFLFVLCIELLLAAIFYEDVFNAVIVPVGIVGFVVLILNQMYMAYGFSFDVEDDDADFVLLLLNGFVFPIATIIGILIYNLPFKQIV